MHDPNAPHHSPAAVAGPGHPLLRLLRLGAALLVVFCTSWYSLNALEEEGLEAENKPVHQLPVEVEAQVTGGDGWTRYRTPAIKVELLGNRRGGDKRRALGNFRGSRASEAAVDTALLWFLQHQGADGEWSLRSYPDNCSLAGPKTEPGASHPDAGGDLTVSAQALLCFLGAGYDHKQPNKYRRAVQAGLTWLLKQQQEDGSFAEDNIRVDAQAALALVEALGMTQDPALQEPAQRAIAHLLAQQQQQPEQALGWGLRQGAAMDTVTTAWVLQSLRLAESLGLEVGNGLVGGKNYARKVWQEEAEDFLLSWDPAAEPQDIDEDSSFHLAAGAQLAIWAWGREDIPMAGPMLKQLMARALQHAAADHQVRQWPMNVENLLWTSQTVLQLGGGQLQAAMDNHWPQWNGAFRDALIAGQRQEEGCFKGSWDPQETRFVGHQLGRLLVTAYATQSLQTYYRYAPMRIKP